MITVYGGRGTGRTAVCEQLHDAHAGRLHVAKWPMPGAQPIGMAPPPDQANPLTSRPLAALGGLVRELGVDVPKFDRVDFPRFTYGLMAATTLYDPLGTGHTDGPALADLQRLEHRLRAPEEALPGGERPLWDTLADIKETWRRLRGQSKAEGASGWICLKSDGTPYDKAVAVVRLVPPAAGRTGKGTLAFQAVAWPTGRPLTEDMCRNARG